MKTIPLAVWIHMLAAMGALALGIVMLTRVKGDRLHRRLGWTWVVLMSTVAVSSLWIPGFLKFSWIHVFTLVTAVSLPLAIYRIRHGNVRAHAAAMKGVFFGGLVIAGAFAFVPGRILGNALVALVRL